MRRVAPSVLKALRPALRRNGIALRRADPVLDRWGLFFTPPCARNLIFRGMAEDTATVARELMGNPPATGLDRPAELPAQ